MLSLICTITNKLDSNNQIEEIVCNITKMSITQMLLSFILSLSYLFLFCWTAFEGLDGGR